MDATFSLQVVLDTAWHRVRQLASGRIGKASWFCMSSHDAYKHTAVLICINIIVYVATWRLYGLKYIGFTEGLLYGVCVW